MAPVGTPDYVQVNSTACDIKRNTLNIPRLCEPQSLAKKRFLHLCCPFVLVCQCNFIECRVTPETEESLFS